MGTGPSDPLVPGPDPGGLTSPRPGGTGTPCSSEAPGTVMPETGPLLHQPDVTSHSPGVWLGRGSSGVMDDGTHTPN